MMWTQLVFTGFIFGCVTIRFLRVNQFVVFEFNYQTYLTDIHKIFLGLV